MLKSFLEICKRLPLTHRCIDPEPFRYLGTLAITILPYTLDRGAWNLFREEDVFYFKVFLVKEVCMQGFVGQ